MPCDLPRFLLYLHDRVRCHAGSSRCLRNYLAHDPARYQHGAAVPDFHGQFWFVDLRSPAEAAAALRHASLCLCPIEFDSVLVDGGTVAYWAQHLGEFAQTTEPLKELFPAGGFGLKGLVKVFGVPGAALALYSTAKPEKKKIVAGLLIPATLTSIVAGVTEPLEYTFLFVAPVLFVIHAVLSATLMVVSYSLGVVGSFGGGLIDWAAQNYIPLGANHWQMYLIHILVGLVFVGIWFVVFRTVILKFNLKTPGREDDDATEVSLKTKADYQAKTNHKKAEKTAYAKQIIEALGGPENILEVTNCMTRLRVSVKDAAQVQGNDYFRSIGAHGVVKVGNAVQVIVGVNAPFIRGTVNELLDSERSVS